MSRHARLALFVVLLTSQPYASSAEQAGVLIVAHGGSAQWNRMVRQVVKQAQLSLPTELALGMGMHPQEVRRLQAAVDRLERRGVHRLVVVPLFISSYSEVFRQHAYLFGLRPQAEWPEVGAPLTLHVPVVMGEALDDSPMVADILLERARRLSQTPAQETVVLVAHGPNQEVDNRRWLEHMQQLGQRIKRDGRFHDVLAFTIRDDAPAAVREEATRQLREAVRAVSQDSRVLVVPLLIAQGGIEGKIPTLLAGLSYLYTGETLLPHPNVAHWIIQEVTQLRHESARSEASSLVIK